MSVHTTNRPAILALLVAIAVSLACSLAGAAPALAAQDEGCPNEQVRAESNVNPSTGQPYSQGLPECRAYEMVSPLDKQAHEANLGPIGPLVAPSGEAVEYTSEGAFAGTENYLVTGFKPHLSYIARRTVNGWVTEPALVPSTVISDPTSDGLSGDASPTLSLLSTCGYVGFTTDAGDGADFACARRESKGIWDKTPDYPSLEGTTVAALTHYWGSSSDLADVVWQPANGTELLPGGSAPAGSGAIYETLGLGTESPRLAMVSVNNENTPLTIEHGNSGPYLGGARWTPEIEGSAYQAVSSDGQTVYFTAEPAGGGPLTLFARTGDFAGGIPASPTTVEIAPNATYEGASSDGSQVFFLTSEKLVGSDADSTADLYEYDFDAPAGHHYVQVSGGGLGDTSPGAGAEVGRVVGISSDGSHIYFESRAMLTTLPNGDEEHASQGGANVYGYDTETEHTQFVATAAVEAGTAGYLTRANEQNAQVTPDGRYLLFATAARLSGEDHNNGVVLYRYDFETGDIAWISHGATGFAATNEGDRAILPGFEEEREGANADFADLRRAISENGEYVVFRTKEKLQADDVNEAPDVYLWHNGTVSLISDGTSAAGVTEAPGMSATGSDIVFATTSQLVGQDTDHLQDIYNARIDGGFSAPTPEPICSGEACQGNPSPAPTFGIPGTQSFTDAGNQIAPPFKEVLEPVGKKTGPSRAQLLQKALARCKRERPRKRWASCQRAAQRRYGSKKKTKG